MCELGSHDGGEPVGDGSVWILRSGDGVGEPLEHSSQEELEDLVLG